MILINTIKQMAKTDATAFGSTLLAKKLCDSSFLGQNLDLIHSHFKTDRVMSFIF